MWVVTRHQYGIATLVTQTSFRAQTSPVTASRNCRLFSQARNIHLYNLKLLELTEALPHGNNLKTHHLSHVSVPTGQK